MHPSDDETYPLPADPTLAAVAEAMERRTYDHHGGARRLSVSSVVIGWFQPQDSSDGSSQLSYDSSIEPSSP